jgi:Tfp pilus assembly protein PilN
MAVPNLAREPFANHRPVRRAALLAWTGAIALLAVDSWLYWRHFSSRGAERTELAELEARTAGERTLLDAAAATLERFDLEWQDEQITFLNARIAERTFSWSALFDDLVEVLPSSVRIERLTPRLDSRDRGRRAPRAPGDEVVLEITGAAERDEALLELVDDFFAHPRFNRPNLRVESRQKGGNQVTYSMSVVYRPQRRAAGEPVDAAAGASVDATPEAPADPVSEPEVRS